jgi:hypothetical protein
MAASWFSNTAEDPDRIAEKPPPKEILAKRLEELRSRSKNSVINSHAPARSRRAAEHSSFQRFSFQPFSSTQIPLFPRNPLFPASGLATGSLNGLNPKSKFLVF